MKFKGNQRKQLEMLQLINYSYEMTAACVRGDHIKNWLQMRYGAPEDMPYIAGQHFKNLNILEHQDGNFHYTERPKRLSDLLHYPEGPDDGICDPAKDPHPANVSENKAKKGESEADPLEGVRGYEWIGRFSDEGAVEGNVFKKDGTYYMVFDGTEPIRDFIDDVIVADGWGIVMGHFQSYLEEAYRVYQKITKKIPGFDNALKNEQVCFLGHSLGGALASSLSAGIYLNAFDDDEKFDKTRYQRENPEPSGANIPTLTFNAPHMGWFFDKSEFVTGGYQIFHREERLNDVNVSGVRMSRDPVSDLRRHANGRFQIGKTLETLGDTAGRLGAYFENELNRKEEYWHYNHLTSPNLKELLDSQSGLFFWHGTNTLELALMDKVEEEEKEKEEPKEPNPPQVRVDPLILDLNRDGKVSTTAGKRYFDLDANGIAERASWAASGDGFLAMDRDGDGKITSGRELFGDHTVMSDGRVASSGFQALADLDSNKDGKIDASDEAFGRLRIWSDRDGDGHFGDQELSTLSETGIESIGLSYTDQRTEDENGNQIVRTGRFAWSDGERGRISEFLLSRDSIHTLTQEKLEEPEDIAALPDLAQRGFLYSLHQAMVRDGSGELKKLTEQFGQEENSAARRSLLDRILLKWSAVSNEETTPNGGWLGFLDKFYGVVHDWDSLTDRGRRQLLSAYESVSLYLYGKLLQQSHYADELEMLDYDMDDTGRVFLGTGRVLASIASAHVSDPDQVKRSIGEFFLALKSAGLYEYVKEEELESHAAVLSTYGSELPDVCRASYLAMSRPVGTYTLPYYVSQKGGVVDGDIHNNVLVGSESVDVVKGGYGSDILMGGKGSDTLIGGHDGDTYVWNLGDGDDTIVNSTVLGEEDVLRLGKGVHPENVTVERHGNTIRLRIGESGEVLTLATDLSVREEDIPLKDAMDPTLQVARVEFSDGTVWSRMLSSLWAKNKQGCRIGIHSANLVPVDCR